MKKINKSSSLVLALLLALLFTQTGCDNDNAPAPNDNQCNFQGLTFNDSNGNIHTSIAESDLTTEYYTATSNGPAVEIYETAQPGNFNFSTNVVNEGDSGPGTINYNGSTYAVTVTCQRGVTGSTGAAVGDDFRYDITTSGLEVELCVIQDVLKLGYIDADGDGCGSQTVSYTIGVLNNLDTDDTDPNVCL